MSVVAVAAEEAVLIGVKSFDRRIDGVYGKMIAALTVLCLVEDLLTFVVDFNLTCAVIALEVRHVIHCVPQAELYIRKDIHGLFGRIFIL